MSSKNIRLPRIIEEDEQPNASVPRGRARSQEYVRSLSHVSNHSNPEPQVIISPPIPRTEFKSNTQKVTFQLDQSPQLYRVSRDDAQAQFRQSLPQYDTERLKKVSPMSTDPSRLYQGFEEENVKRPSFHKPNSSYDIYEIPSNYVGKSRLKSQRTQKLERQKKQQEILEDSSEDEGEYVPLNQINVLQDVQNFITEQINKRRVNYKTLQQQKKEEREDNYESLQWAIRLRSITRIIYLLIITALCFTAFYIISNFFTQYQGGNKIESNSNIYLNITNCKLNIIDMEYQPMKNVSITLPFSSHKIKTNISRQPKIVIAPEMEIVYKIPGRFSFDSDAKTSNVVSDINGQDYTYVFDNVLSLQSCSINLQIYSAISMKDLVINCHGTCSMMILAQNITFQNVVINGSHINVNAQYLQSNTISYHSIRGRFQGNYLKFKTGDIRLQEGDIIVQSDQDLMVNWTHSLPNYCIGSPVVGNPIVIGCSEPPQSDIDLYLSGKSTTEIKESVKAKNTSVNTTEKYTDDDDEDPTVIFMPSFETYQGSKQVQESPKETTTKPKMKRKSNEYKTTEKRVFQPSCYGNAILCKSSDCVAIKQPVIHSYENPYRILEETNGNISSTKEQTHNKTKRPDYKALAKEASEKLPQTIPEGIRFMNLTGRFGNIYVNIIQEKEQRIQTSDTLMHGQSYENNNITFDLPTQKRLKDLIKQSHDAHNFDATFIFQIGSKVTQSDNFQQWTTTKNPAYSYIRPWTIGSYSFTLMSTSTWTLESNLSPGFCPYIPQVDLNDIYNTGYMIKQIFKDDLNAITTINWQKKILFPKQYQDSQTGVRKVDRSAELWLDISKVNDTSYSITPIDLASSFATWWAALFSYIAAFLVAAIAFVAVLYMVNYVYLDIINKVSSSAKYSSIEKKNDSSETQPLMENSVQAQIKNEQDKDIPIHLTIDPTILIYQIFVLAPPLSAFIDYLCLLVRKQFTNSVDDFYSHLFMPQNPDQQLHDLSSEAILGNSLKTLYEKFCYLNGLLEIKLDDPSNIKKLQQKGFKIETREDSQTESYIRVLLNGFTPKVESQPDKSTLDLFIANCCKTSNFEEDNVIVQTFNQTYQEFCLINHFDFQQPLASELQDKYKIVSKFISQQWIIRDEDYIPKMQPGFYTSLYNCVNKCFAFCIPQKHNYVINKQKVENHFALIMNNLEKIKTSQEVLEANHDLILFRGWWLDDFLTVFVHFLTTIILVLPLFIFDTLQMILYAQFSLSSSEHLITWEDVIENPLSLTQKLYSESDWMMTIVAIYWCYSILDLLYYYAFMEFPQENYFRVRSVNKFQSLFSSIMWLLVLYSSFVFCYHCALALVWLLLGAIVNPTAFLPYATASATFVTVISTKATQYRKIALDGFQTVIQVIQNTAQKQMANMIAKFDLKGKFDMIIESQTFKDITAQAESLGIIDRETMKKIDNFDQLLANPDKLVESTISEVEQIGKDPGAYLVSVVKQIEDKAIVMVKDQITKQVDVFGEQLAEVVVAMFKKDQKAFQNNMTQLILTASTSTHLESLKTMSTPIMNLIWEFAYPNQMLLHSNQGYMSQLFQQSTDLISQLLINEIQLNFPEFDQKSIQVILKVAISLEKNTQEGNTSEIFQNIQELLQLFAVGPYFELRIMSKFMGLFKVISSIFETNKSGKKKQINFQHIFTIISGFFDDIPQLKELKELLGIIEILVNTFRKQQKLFPTKVIRARVDSCISFIRKISQQRPDLADKFSNNGPLMTLMFSFMQHHFDKIPKDLLNVVIAQFIVDWPQIKDIIQSEKEQKKFGNLLSKSLEFMTFFMESNTELTTTLHKAAGNFSIEQRIAQQIEQIFTLRNLKYISYEGSAEEETLFYNLRPNMILLNLSRALRLDMKLTMGVISILMKLWNRGQVVRIYEYIAKINKVELYRVKQFFSLLILFRSTNEQHLANAVYDLKIPQDYLILVLLAKRIIKKEYIDYSNLERLNITKEEISELQKLEDIPSMISRIKKHWEQNPEASLPEGISSKLKIFLISQLTSQDQINQNIVNDYLIIIGNNFNTFAILKQFEIDLLSNILQMRYIQLNSGALNSQTKQGIYAFAHILNMKKQILEDLCNIIFLPNAQRVVASIISIQATDSVIIAPGQVQDFEQYLDFIFQKYNILKQREQYLDTTFKTVFPMIRIPVNYVKKLIFNEQIKMDINSIYDLSKLMINLDNDSEVIQQLRLPISFMTSTMNTQDYIKELQKSMVKYPILDGHALIISMLNENNKKRASQIFLDYLINNSKKSKKDDKRLFPEVYGVFACLYLFFSGQSSELKVPIEGSDPMPIVDYISTRLDIKIEFFQALHTFFSKDNQKFTDHMIRFMRRQEACKFEAQNPGIEIPLQSLVKIPDAVILNFINLITKDNYQTTFFSKELEINHNFVIFVNLLKQIQHSTKIERKIHLQSLINHGPLLKNIHLYPDDIKVLISLIFQDYSSTQIQLMISQLNLHQIKINDIQMLLLIDTVIDPIEKSPIPLLEEQIRANNLIDKMKLNKDMVMIAKGLSRGMFGQMDYYVSKMPNLANSLYQDDYNALMAGLVGAISGHVPEKFNVKLYLRQMYKQLLDPNKKDTPAYFQQGTNQIQYAYYQLTKIIQINPMLLLLTQDVLPAWKMLYSIYNNVLDRENKWLNPLVVFQMILTMHAMPTLIKEIFTEYEWYTLHRAHVEVKEPNEFTEQQQEFREFMIDELFTEHLKSEQEIRDLASKFGIDPKIPTYILKYNTKDIQEVMLGLLADSAELILDEIQYLPQLYLSFKRLIVIIKEEHSKNPLKTYEQIVKSNFPDEEEQKLLLQLQGRIHYQGLIQCYQELQGLFIDPRFPEGKEFQDEELYMSKQTNPFTMQFNLGICTQLAKLRHIYTTKFDNVNMRDNEHAKIVTHEIDYILTSIERLYSFKQCLSTFSKPRAIQMLGLAAGFIINPEHMILANCTASIANIQWASKQYDKLLFTNNDNVKPEQEQSKWDIIGRFFQARTYFCGRDQRIFKDYDYEALKLLKPDIETEPDLYTLGSIQRSGSEESDSYGFNWEDYFYDVGFVKDGSELAKKCIHKGFHGEQFNEANRSSIMCQVFKDTFVKQMQSSIYKQEESYNYLKQIQSYQAQSQQAQSQNNNLVQSVIQTGPTRSSQYQTYRPQFQGQLHEYRDPRNKLPYLEVFQAQEIWRTTCYEQSENFQLLLDIFKSNYSTILQPETYFTDDDPQNAPVYYGLLGLQGAHYKKNITYTELQKYINSCCWSMKSNAKNLSELLSVFIHCFEGFPSLTSLSSNADILHNFIKLSLGLDKEEQQSQLVILVSATSLALKDQQVLLSLILSYLGRVDIFYQLAEYSSYISSIDRRQTFKLANNIIRSTRAKQVVKQVDERLSKSSLRKSSQKQRVQVVAEQPSDLYFSVKKILKRILYGFDKQELHNHERIEWSSYNFYETSSLTLDPSRTKDAFTTLIWQLAQAVTKETMPDELKLATLSEQDAQHDDEVAEQYRETKAMLDPLQQLIISLLDDDYSYFFMRNIAPSLQRLSIISKEENSQKPFQDIAIIQALIGLKASKIQAVISKQNYLVKVRKIQQMYNIEINELIDTLVQSGFINIKISNVENPVLSRQISALFLGISNGNISSVIEALMETDSMSACFILMLHSWKNMSIILDHSRMFMSVPTIMYAVSLLPILIYSQINEQQDSGKPSQDLKRRQLITILQDIVQQIKQDLPSQQIYQEIQDKNDFMKDKYYQFHWSLWISEMPNIINSLKFKRLELIGLLKLITGLHLTDKIQRVRFFSNLVTLYVESNKLVNPLAQSQRLQTFPKTINALSDILPVTMVNFLNVFDKLVQLFVYIQIPEGGNQILSSQILDDEPASPKEHGQLDSKGNSIIVSLVIDMIQSTTAGLFNSLKSESSYILNNDKQNLEAQLGGIVEEEKRIEQILTQLQNRLQQIQIKSKDVADKNQRIQGQQQQTQQQSIQQPTYTTSRVSTQQVYSQQPQQYSSIQPPQYTSYQPIQQSSSRASTQQGYGVPVNSRQSAIATSVQRQSNTIQEDINNFEREVFNVTNRLNQIRQSKEQISAMIQQLKQQLQTINETYKEIRKILTGLIILLMGYDINSRAQIPLKQQIPVMQYLVDTLLFKNLQIAHLVNSNIIRSIYEAILNITQSPVKEISNPEFIRTILYLLYQVSGQDIPEDLRLPQRVLESTVNYNNKQWEVSLPMRYPIINLPMNIIHNIFLLTTGDLTVISDLLKELSVSESIIKIVENVISQVQGLGAFGGKLIILPQAPLKDTKKTQEIQELMKKIEQGTATASDMFKAIDMDGSNSISKEEFNILSRRLGMNLSEHRTNEIFASIKKQESEQNLNEAEFQKAMTYLQSKNTNMALNFLGISPSILTMWLIVLAATLLMIFVFIFFGIQAFALGGTFGAIINSILPMIAGAGASSKTEKLGDKDISETPVTEVVEKTQKIIQSDQI